MGHPYVMAMCQPRTQLAFSADNTFLPDMLADNVEHHRDLILRAATEHDAKLVVFPQFSLTGTKRGLSVEDWIGASLTFPGPEIDQIADAASQAGAHVVIHATERHPAFPGRYFSSAALIGPDRKILLTHRKNYVITNKTRPIDVYDKFIETFGADSLFPVADTPLGRIAIAIAGEVNWPETVRSLTLRGAEIIANPTSAAPLLDYMARPGAEAVKAARAFENMVYLGMANIGSVIAEDPALERAEGLAPPSEIYDFNGALAAKAERGSGNFACCTVDLPALRQARMRPSANFVAQLQPRIHHDAGAERILWPENAFADAPVSETRELIEIEAAVRERLAADGRLSRP